MFFSNTHWPQLKAPFYSILFETSIRQFNSSKCSPIMPDEVREHLTRDQRPFLHPESLQILQIHSSKCSPILPDEVREHLTRDQRPFLHPESLQILQIHSSKCSPILPDEVREHLTRDQRPFSSSRISPDPSV